MKCKFHTKRIQKNWKKYEMYCFFFTIYCQKYSDENGKYKQLRTRYEVYAFLFSDEQNIKSDYRTLQKDFQLVYYVIYIIFS